MATKEIDQEKFAQWCSEVNRIFRAEHQIQFDMTENTGTECWLEWFVDGMTAQEAVDEEVSNWED